MICRLQAFSPQAHFIRVDPGKQRGELVAAEPGGNVARADLSTQRVSHNTECLVTLVMSVLVVDLLEPVDVEEHERQVGC